MIYDVATSCSALRRGLKEGALFRGGRPTSGVATPLGCDLAVIDLRSSSERDECRSFYHDCSVSFPMGFDGPRSTYILMAKNRGTINSVEQVCDSYLRLVDQSRGRIARCFEWMASRIAGSYLIHCASGKDRTGIFIGLLLRLLGFPAEAAAEDYERAVLAQKQAGNPRLERMFAAEGLSLADYAELVYPDRMVLSRLLEALEGHGQSIASGLWADEERAVEVVAALRGLFLKA